MIYRCFRHWLAVLRGETTCGAPAEYVAGLFDGYAETRRFKKAGHWTWRFPEMAETYDRKWQKIIRETTQKTAEKLVEHDTVEGQTARRLQDMSEPIVRGYAGIECQNVTKSAR